MLCYIYELHNIKKIAHIFSNETNDRWHIKETANADASQKDMKAFWMCVEHQQSVNYLLWDLQSNLNPTEHMEDMLDSGCIYAWDRLTLCGRFSSVQPTSSCQEAFLAAMKSQAEV